ncbi:AlkA N-terminal domain-containing protein [Halomonas elongata]|uniref:DNA-3-methyladenine glycosylase II n=1 Tax=Halomonas elongata (strain ATCC 33173 / DSM 2581 / NBRC 15536 / NCIMB 2198 / 1H9) TaxID=768066 RepID=E1V740_HALED|nr:AlkA N-terminal domain-containing protein [Halomonas elongata]WBF18627.1 helix-turn-helix domain-containing protein [Halomonas elongata]WPU47481.1 AlkA N-terminal domain-containing protein [Halomonas elongata DSM 2581]CBV41390.1 AlkA/HTH domain protein [Halomonas elongata DSM 2581]
MLEPSQCRQARLARDARFDGRFFVAVTSTGVYCRPICPATPPHERNVRYYESALAASRDGFRPCLRCRPDSAPDSPAWRGTHTTFERALRLIDEGALREAPLGALCERLGIGERYLRQLFQQRLGVSPKTYALHRQCLFAKQLLHQTRLPVTEVAYASGFRSLRRFNDAFRRHIGLAPRELRRRGGTGDDGLTLTLSYRPPYAWHPLHDFHRQRAIDGLEWVGEHHYGRHVHWGSARGWFTAEHDPEHHAFRVHLMLDDLAVLAPVVRQIRRVLDLDADTATIESHLGRIAPGLSLTEGLRLPGVWSPFEAGVRAILGQQVSIVAARRLVGSLVEQLGEPAGDGYHFPTPESVAASELEFLRMPGARKATLQRFASWYAGAGSGDDPLQWTALKGIGPWTANYAAMRGIGHPDIWLDGDAGVRRTLDRLGDSDPADAAPWRSYLTLQLWSQEPTPDNPEQNVMEASR